MLIVIGSSPGREQWLADASGSIQREHIAVVNYGYELAKIRWALENTQAERFLFLQDSFIVKDQALFGMLEAFPRSVALYSDPAPYGCFAGVYERSVLQKVGVPFVDSKRDAVRLEIEWTRKYVEAAGNVPVLFPKVRDATGYIEDHNGRDNLVLENKYIIKYKGTWKEEQIVS